MRSRGTAIIPVLAVVQGVVEGAEQRVPGPAADTVKVVCVDTPGHDAGETLVVSKISLIMQVKINKIDKHMNLKG